MSSCPTAAAIRGIPLSDIKSKSRTRNGRGASVKVVGSTLLWACRALCTCIVAPRVGPGLRVEMAKYSG